MPTIQIPTAPYRFFFYSNESQEPAHVHVSHTGREAKLWVNRVCLASNDGFPAQDLKKIKTLAEEYEEEIAAAWAQHFG